MKETWEKDQMSKRDDGRHKGMEDEMQKVRMGPCECHMPALSAWMMNAIRGREKWTRGRLGRHVLSATFLYLAGHAGGGGHEGGGQAHNDGGHEGEEGKGDTHFDLGCVCVWSVVGVGEER